jgi:hypothetical protein
MKILFLSPINHNGKFDDFKFGYRPIMSWITALDAIHWNYNDIDSIDNNSRFDVAIISVLNSISDINIDTFFNKTFNKLKKISDKIVIQQESYHRSIIHDCLHTKRNIYDLHIFYKFYENCDAILTHNQIDNLYYEGLFNKPCYVHPQLLIDDDLLKKTEENDNVNYEDLSNKQVTFILSSDISLSDKSGGMDAYMLLKNLDYPIYTFSGNKPYNFKNLYSFDPNYDYLKFNEKISNFKIAISIPSLPIGGSFPLHCAMKNVPCVGWNASTPLFDCFPDLTAEYPNFKTLKNIINKLINDKNFYIECTKKGRKNFIEKYSVEKYINNMNVILNEILK